MGFLSKIINNRGPKKWSTERIRRRFDADSDLFAQLTEGQAEIVDAKLMRDLVVNAAQQCTPNAQSAIDVGCGGGFYGEGLLRAFPNLKLLITDLSREMLDNAAKKLAPLSIHEIHGIHGDIRNVELDLESVDIITAAAVLHHLREDDEWIEVFSKLYSALKPNGSLWITDIVAFNTEKIQELMNERYTNYLTELHNHHLAKKIMNYIELEDSPRPLAFQLDLLKKVGFSTVEVLHANTSFAAFGAIKS